MLAALFFGGDNKWEKIMPKYNYNPSEHSGEFLFEPNKARRKIKFRKEREEGKKEYRKKENR